MNNCKIKRIIKLEIAVIIQGNTEVLRIAYLKYSVPQKIRIVFHNRSNYNYNFIIKELTEEYKRNLLV